MEALELMTYKDATKYLFEQFPSYQKEGSKAYKANLDNITKLCEYLNNPQKNLKCIHVAGTNGKGSVSHMLAAVLQQQGYKTGLFTSPHLHDFRERIKINGQLISEENVINFVEINRPIFNDLQPSFFEITTAMAFKYFADENVDIAIIETGLGGRLDSTNIIQPIVSVITNISFDHMRFLGDTLESIASEKAGIIKENTPVVIGEYTNETKPVFEQKAQTLNSPIHFASDTYKIMYSMRDCRDLQSFNIEKNGKFYWEQLKVDQLGFYQSKNLITMLQTYELLQSMGWEITQHSLFKGLEKTQEMTGLKGKWQFLGYNPLIICDTAHNVSGLEEAFFQINLTPYKNLHIILGVVPDRDFNQILPLLPKNALYYATNASNARAMEHNALMRELRIGGLHADAYENAYLALLSAKEKAGSQDLIFITGSTYLIADIIN